MLGIPCWISWHKINIGCRVRHPINLTPSPHWDYQWDNLQANWSMINQDCGLSDLKLTY